MQRYDLRHRSSHNARQTYTACKPTALPVAIDSVMQRAGNAVSWSLAAAHGLMTHPFFDRAPQAGAGQLKWLSRASSAAARSRRPGDIICCALGCRRNLVALVSPIDGGLERNRPAKLRAIYAV